MTEVSFLKSDSAIRLRSPILDWKSCASAMSCCPRSMPDVPSPDDSRVIFLMVSSHSVFISATSMVSSPNWTVVAEVSLSRAVRRVW